MRTEQEIEDELDEVPPDGPSEWPGMTYEQGVERALRWVLEWDDGKPVSDE